ncbi:hypothetical protein ANCDUO_16159, partial [Ancylostoma duodenale]
MECIMHDEIAVLSHGPGAGVHRVFGFVTLLGHFCAETVWAACRAVIFGCIVIAVGLAMTVLGYFDKQFSERIEIVDGTPNIYHDRVVQYQLKSMQ